jgi:hypothetical protein
MERETGTLTVVLRGNSSEPPPEKQAPGRYAQGEKNRRMRTLSLIIGLIIGFAISCKAQLKLPFPDSTGAWRISWTMIDYPNVYTGAYRYYIHGDSICNSTLYKKLYYGSNDIFDSTIYSPNDLRGLFRLDSNKVYYKNLNQSFEEFGFIDTSEVLLYDFSLTIGDSIMNYNNGTDQNYIAVTTIDTIIINGEILRQWHFNTGFVLPLVWIEGIGSNIGFFNYFLFFETGLTLACFHELSQDYVVNLAIGSSCETVGINSLEQKTNMSIYPNPTNDYLSISTSTKSEIEISNIEGQIIKRLKIKDNKTDIDISDFSSGVYIIRVQTDRGIMTKKFIKE